MTITDFSYPDRLEAAICGLPALSRTFPEAAALLDFLAPVLATQQRLASAAPYLVSLDEAVTPRWSAALRDMAATCASHGTPEIAAAAATVQQADDAALATLVSRFIHHGDGGDAERMIVMSALGGIAANLPTLHPVDGRAWLKPFCPVCSMPPIASYLADIDEIDGCRLLYCGVCHSSWHYGRTTCHSCGSNDDHQFDYFHPDGNRGVVIQACRCCMTYLKTIDMRHYYLTVPEAIDTATVALDLFARDKGFTKEFHNIFGC